jgi:hypothetical protein
MTPLERWHLGLETTENRRGFGQADVPSSRQAYFVASAQNSKSMLEVSPLAAPILPQDSRTRNIDVGYKSDLIAKYAHDPSVDKDKIVDVHYKWSGQPYKEIVNGDRFDLIVASHVIEHTPDVVGWLNMLSEVLLETGEVKLVIPDARYCFDHFRPRSTIADVVGAFLEQRSKPVRLVFACAASNFRA